jgi:hypothetical protein
MANEEKSQGDLENEDRPDAGVPQPPHFQRRLNIAPLQLLGIPLLAILPILALFGVFGQSTGVVEASNGALYMRVEYVTRSRYRMQEPLRVTIGNRGESSPDSAMPVTITVAFERGYLDHFADIQFSPDVDAITEREYQVELRDVQPGETRIIDVELRGNHYWQKSGTISASIGNEQAVTVTVRTTIFP